MGKTFQLFFIGAAFTAALWLAPTQASAANCHFSKKEAALPIEDASQTELRFFDRRRKRAI